MCPIPTHQERIDIAGGALEEETHGAGLFFKERTRRTGKIGAEMSALPTQADRVAGAIEHGRQGPMVHRIHAQDGHPRVIGPVGMSCPRTIFPSVVRSRPY